MLLLHLRLAKAPLVLLVLGAAAAGYCLATGASPGWETLVWTLLGTGLASGGANAFNQWAESSSDALMRRTRLRPLPANRMAPRHALVFAADACLSGLLILAAFTNWLAAGLCLAAVLIYLLVYTPLKKRSPICTLAGAVCGALPPLVGWAAAAGCLSYSANLLALLLFVWQIPHFLALGWLHRSDYERAGFRILPVTDRSGRSTAWFALLYSLILLPLALVLSLSGLTGSLGLVATFAAGLVLVLASLRLYREHSKANAKRLFVATLIYLPVVLAVLCLSVL